MGNENCAIGLAEKDEYIVFQKYVVSIVIKRRHFDLFFKKKKKKRLNETSFLSCENDVVLVNLLVK